MDDLQPVPLDHQLPPPAHQTAFWTLFGIFVVSGFLAAVVETILGDFSRAIFVAVAVIAILFVTILNHRHRHDHLWLMGGAAAITVLIAAVALVELIQS